MLLIFIAGLAIPEAFRQHSTLFATTYAGDDARIEGCAGGQDGADHPCR
jgi:hypothetical protein